MSDLFDDAPQILKRGEPKQIREAMEAALRARGHKSNAQSNDRRVTNIIRSAPTRVLLREMLHRLTKEQHRKANRERMRELRSSARFEQA